MAASSAGSLKKRLRHATGDVQAILSLVAEAERLRWSDLRALGDLYAVAMNAIGPLPLQTAPEEYGELCVKRLQVLCSVDKQEACTFNSFLEHYGIRQEDARLQEAVTALGRKSMASGLAPSSPRAIRTLGCQAPRPAGPCTGRGSSTPIRPRTLSYSGCDTSDLEDAIAAVAAGASSGGEDEDHQATCAPLQPASVPKDHHATSAPPQPASAMPARIAAEDVDMEGTGTMEFTQVSDLQQLFPIPEDDPEVPSALAESEAPGHNPAEVSDLSSPAKEAIPVAPVAPKVILVNGVPYTKLQTIGRGGSSKVFKVKTSCGKILALKRVTASCPKHFDALGNEVTLLRQLRDSPNVIQVIDAEVLRERLILHIVMELGDTDLGGLLQAEPDWTLGDIQARWREMLEAVQVVHHERIVHSDLKPGNFLLVGDRLKLIDFGIAKRIASNTTNISRENSVGTISYMAPEAVKQGALKIGRPSDIWSLGIILYQMVYMKSPFAHLDPMQRLFALTDPTVGIEFPEEHRLANHCPATKAALMDVLQKCLQRDPRKRPAMKDLLEHPFLSAETTRLTRSCFDRTMEDLVSSIFQAADGALKQGVQGDPGRSPEDLADAKACWQLLSDQVWQRLTSSNDDQAPSFTALAPFKDWLSRGVSKRQRLNVGAPAKEQQKKGPSSANSGAGMSSATSKNPSAPATRTPSPSCAPSVEVPRQRTPLMQLNAGSGQVPIHAEQLQKQRQCLRKAGANAPGAATGKENLGLAPARLGSAGFANSNLAVRRLQASHAKITDYKPEEQEEHTQLTCWGP
eukprot:TRINITY_DN9369_c1_g2_i2.p1 TRINITY_DN9369_c1_g2~~TRINITY_DN9369_c1_g2_i2.p1  ORF type:complete len:801 (-),score=150.00 TRINITY_DN9369_c1_g2_i2:108-2510(-)